MDLSRTPGYAGPEQSARVEDSAGVSGDIMEPEGYAARQQAQLEILQSLERGELSPQDAMQRLNELDGE